MGTIRAIASVSFAALAAASFAACAAGDSGGGGASLEPGDSGDSSGTTHEAADAVDCAGGGGLRGECAPQGPPCTDVPSRCMALADNCGRSSYALRIAHLTVTKPALLATGIVADLLANDVLMNLPQCNLQGTGAMSWILAFDEPAGALTMGSARPAADPVAGYCMMNEVVQSGGASFTIAPVTTQVSIASDGAWSSSPIASITIPLFASGARDQLLPLPMRQVHFHDAKLSPERRCIGEYNADGLDPGRNCLANPPASRTFNDGGAVDGFLTLADADEVVIASLGQSLCVLLSGDPATFGNGGSPNQCKRDARGGIVFRGDWCAGTDQPATDACHNAVRFSATFAASAVALRSGC